MKYEKSNELIGQFTRNEEYEGEGRDKLRLLLNRILREELTKRQQEYMDLYLFEKRSITEIAKIKGVGKSTVSKSLARAFRRMRLILEYRSM